MFLDSTKKFKGYTKQEVEISKLSFEMQDTVYQSSEHEYKDIVIIKLLPKSPINIKDINDAKIFLGRI